MGRKAGRCSLGSPLPSGHQDQAVTVLKRFVMKYSQSGSHKWLNFENEIDYMTRDVPVARIEM